MKKSARVSEKLVSPGLPGLQVATRLQNATGPGHGNFSFLVKDCAAIHFPSTLSQFAREYLLPDNKLLDLCRVSLRPEFGSLPK